jgi:hypothetical protein
MANQILSEEFRRMQKLAGLSEASGEDMGGNMYGITKEFKFGSEPGGPFKLELFSNGDMGISDGSNYLGLTNKDAKELSEILKQIMGKVNEGKLNENVASEMVKFVSQNFDTIKANFLQSELEMLDDIEAEEEDYSNLNSQMDVSSAEELIDVINERSMGVDLENDMDASELFDMIKELA